MSIELEDFAELDALIAQEMEKSNEEKALKVLRKRVFGANATQTEREAHAAEVAALELKVIWRPVAQVAHFKRTQCRCGAIHREFEGILLEMAHRTQSGSRRWALLPNIGSDLPKKTMFRDVSTEMCWACFDGMDWNLLDAEVHCTAASPKTVAEDLLNELEELKDGQI